MSATARTETSAVFGTQLPKLWKPPTHRSLFGDAVLVAFLLTQLLDGTFTYIGVVAFGPSIEANPLLAAMMRHLGHGAALMAAKMAAGSLGIGLHLRGTHMAVALLTVFYTAAAVLPWVVILFGGP